ncbi:hypothetical protein [Terrabacter sp. BE26]|uniref:hypothetical protein n=1 Tax=Terrabacter sp. BE26 TaxID=2898152 RepID=UPI0035BE7405
MRVGVIRGPGRAALAWLTALSIGGLAACGAGSAASTPARTSRPTTGPLETRVRVLQMNLCNSGRAACYAGGRAVSMAVTLAHEDRPDMITLNEVCRDDVRVLKQAMSMAWRGATIAEAFASAKDRPSQAPVLCRNGQEFGDAVLVMAPSSSADVRTGVYPVQDSSDPEERVWACIDLARRFSACTTHTASTNATVALEQCRYLLTSVVPGIRRRSGGAPAILGGDLNLPARSSPSALACLPTGYQHTDDDAVQHVVASPGAELRSRSVIDMQGTTDHPGLLVDLAFNAR